MKKLLIGCFGVYVILATSYLAFAGTSKKLTTEEMVKLSNLNYEMTFMEIKHAQEKDSLSSRRNAYIKEISARLKIDITKYSLADNGTLTKIKVKKPIPEKRK